MRRMAYDKKYQITYQGDLFDTTSVIVANNELPIGYLESRQSFLFKIESIGK